MSENNNLNLQNNLTEAFPISSDAAESYENVLVQLIDYVNIKLESNTKIKQLIGGNPLYLMHNNHKNHAMFLNTVFKMNSSELLANTVPWVYRAYRARGFSYDYFLVELEAWKDAINKYLDNPRANEIIKIYNWMIANHEIMIHLSLKNEGLNFSPKDESNEMQEALLSLLLHGDIKECLKLVNESVQIADDLKYFYLDVVCPVMCRIGLLWEKNEISVAEEHLATAIVARIITALYAKFANVDVYRGKAVVATAPNEFHELGARIVADFLEINGWDVTYLGADTPLNEIITILKKHKPFILGLSVTIVFNLDNAHKVIKTIKEDKDIQDINIMVGGLAFHASPSLWSNLGANGYAKDFDNALIIANKWWDKRIE